MGAAASCPEAGLPHQKHEGKRAETLGQVGCCQHVFLVIDPSLEVRGVVGLSISTPKLDCLPKLRCSSPASSVPPWAEMPHVPSISLSPPSGHAALQELHRLSCHSLCAKLGMCPFHWAVGPMTVQRPVGRTWEPHTSSSGPRALAFQVAADLP